MRLIYIFIFIAFIANCTATHQEYEEWVSAIKQDRAVKFLKMHDKYIERIPNVEMGKQMHKQFSYLSYEHQLDEIEDIWLYKTHDELNDACWVISIVVPILFLSYLMYRAKVIYDHNSSQSVVKFDCYLCRLSLYFE